MPSGMVSRDLRKRHRNCKPISPMFMLFDDLRKRHPNRKPKRSRKPKRRRKRREQSAPLQIAGNVVQLRHTNTAPRQSEPMALYTPTLEIGRSMVTTPFSRPATQPSVATLPEKCDEIREETSTPIRVQVDKVWDSTIQPAKKLVRQPLVAKCVEIRGEAPAAIKTKEAKLGHVRNALRSMAPVRVAVDKAWESTPQGPSCGKPRIVDGQSCGKAPIVDELSMECHVTSDTLLLPLGPSSCDHSNTNEISCSKSRTLSLKDWEASWFDKIESINQFNLTVPRTPIRSRTVSKRVSLYHVATSDARKRKKIILELVESL